MKENLGYIKEDSILVIYRKNATTYKQVLTDSNIFSNPIQIDNFIIDNFFISKVTKLSSKKDRKLERECRKADVRFDLQGDYLHIDFYFMKKYYSNFLNDRKSPVWVIVYFKIKIVGG